jgi:hypothetical protein
MEFPISRKRLQEYRLHEAAVAEKRLRVSGEIKRICNDVEHIVSRNYEQDEQKYVYHIRYRDILKELLSAIVTKFLDSRIVVDPLETYILIDWS